MQIANSVDQVDGVANATGLIMTAKVKLALDLWLSEMSGSSDQNERMAARVAQLDGVLQSPDSSAPIN
jgi:hypothetical protein